MDAIETLRLADGNADRHDRRQKLRLPFLSACLLPSGGRQDCGSTLKDYLSIYEQAEDVAWGAHSPDVDGVFELRADAPRGRVPDGRSARGTPRASAAVRPADPGRPIPDPHTEA